MEDLTAEFLNQIGFNPQVEYDEIVYTSDDSEFAVVDGEEGDHGVIKHHSIGGSLLATTTVRGGDDEDTEFTDYGKSLLGARALDILRKCIDTI